MSLSKDQITNVLSNIVRDMELHEDYQDELEYLAQQTKFPDLERFVVESLIQGDDSIAHVAQRLAIYQPVELEKEVAKSELVELVRRIMEVEGSEAEIDNAIDRLQAQVPHPQVMDLIYWPPGGKDLTPEEVVDLALNYRDAND